MPYNQYKPQPRFSTLRYRTQCSRCSRRYTATEPPGDDDLCDRCTNALARYPIPRWVWIAGFAVLVLMNISLFRTPHFFDLSLHLRRAQVALKAHRFNTAEKEAAIVLAQCPDAEQAHFIHYAAVTYAGRPVADAVITTWAARHTGVEDTAMARMFHKEMDFAAAQMTDAVRVDTALYRFKDSSIARIFQRFEMINGDSLPEKMSAGIMFANWLDARRDYENEIKLLHDMQRLAPESFALRYALMHVYQRTGRQQQALAVCNELLIMNPEDSLALTYLRRADKR